LERRESSIEIELNDEHLTEEFDEISNEENDFFNQDTMLSDTSELGKQYKQSYLQFGTTIPLKMIKRLSTRWPNFKLNWRRKRKRLNR
jgi:hypothetical protein